MNHPELQRTKPGFSETENRIENFRLRKKLLAILLVHRAFEVMFDYVSRETTV